MSYYITLFFTYILGGITFIPILLLVVYFSSSKKTLPVPSDVFEPTNTTQEFYKVGWLTVTRGMPSNVSNSLGGKVKSYLSASPDLIPSYFAVLKFNTLYLYDSELQLDCKDIINISQHTVHIYPEGLKDHELFSKPNRIVLKRHHAPSYYLHCTRCVDKEDWYFALRRASQLDTHPPSPLANSCHFDQDAMNHLMSTIHNHPSQFEMQWFNALMGRLFLGIYKTDKTREFFYNKILSKVDKLNARRPHFLETITLRSVDAGHGAPQITQPRLVHLSPQGEYTGDVQFFYDGHFRVELETVLCWTVSGLPPLRVDVVLAITLKSIEGRLMLKIKEPPTNRIWMGFYKKPKMAWQVEPVVWDKRIGYPVVSKAIQTKIEEILTETLVLPNMDDMVFFRTDGKGYIGDEANEYKSMPELYSAPSELVVTAEPLLSTYTAPKKKRWFNNKQEITDSHSYESDTPSQKSLKSVMAGKKNPKKKTKRKKTLKDQVLATSVDHSIDSFQFNQKLLSNSDDNESLKRMHSLRLSKTMLDYPSRLRSKSLPSTTLTEISIQKNE